MKYRCINSFTVDRYDGNGFTTDGFTEISRNSIWERDDEMNIIGGAIHLDNPETMEWLEISKSDLEEYFEPLNGDLKEDRICLK